MTFAPDAARILALLSAAGLLVLAAAFLVLPRRDNRARAFAAFAALWAVQVAAANVGSSETEARKASWAFALSVAAFIPLYLPLAYFASAYPLRDGLLSRSRLAVAAVVAPGLAAAGIMLARPEWIMGRFVEREGGVMWTPGALLAWLVAFPFILAVAYAVRRFGRDARAPGAPILAARAALIATALGAYLAYAGPGYLLYYGIELADTPNALAAGRVAAYAIATAALVGLARDLAASAWPARRRALAFLAAAAIVGVLENVAILADVARTLPLLGTFDTVGLWRLAMVGLVLFALARYQMFDLHERLGLRAPDTRFLRERRLDVYRAALEEALAKPEESHEDRLWLGTLRESLDITEVEHRAIEQAVRAALAAGGRPARPARGIELYRGRFRILRVLGGGGGGQAVLAEDAQLGRRVVLKELARAQRRDPGAVASLLHEAGIMATIQHPNVVTVLEVDRSAEDPAVILEYCEGGSVEDHQLRLGGALAPREVVAITRDALQGLAAIHAKGLVHRDVKPANLLLTADGRAKVADFGLAQTASDSPTTTTRGIDRPQPGTLPYMSPEQVRGPRLDRRSDLYSLAATCYHMATGDVYYGAGVRDTDAIREAILAAPPRLDAAPEWLRAFLAKGLAKRREERFQSAEEMLAALPEPPDITASAGA